MKTRAVSVYINWSAYDELSENIELTEEIALTQLEHLVRLRGLGVRFDYYLMDCFWYARDGAYRTFRKPHFAEGADRWLKLCAEAGVKPGLWIATNSTWCALDIVPAWKDSASPTGALSFAEGGYREDLFKALSEWYEKGVRIFKWDFANFGAATEATLKVKTAAEIRAANEAALREALGKFREEHPECLHIGYNGFEHTSIQDGTGQAFCKGIDPVWLDYYESIYCGDPKPADVACVNFWRAKDLYTDHMVREYAFSDYPLARIDNAGFMIGTTGTCYYRRKAAWKAMLLLSLARGGKVNTYYGNLDLLSDDDGRWFAKAQRLFWPALEGEGVKLLGGVPGRGEMYGYEARDEKGTVVVWVNPGQEFREVGVPEGRVLFADSWVPERKGGVLRMGPEQMVVVGTGEYARAEWDLGVDGEVRIPRAIAPVRAEFVQSAKKSAAEVKVTETGTWRVMMRQMQATAKGEMPKRVTGGKAPTGKALDKLLILRVREVGTGRELPLRIEYNKVIWSGLSWAAGEVDVKAGETLEVVGEVTTEEEVRLEMGLFAVRY